MDPKKSPSWFTRFANGISRQSGRPAAFALAVMVILIWIVTGPIFGFSDTWLLVINTGTSIVTFLMVFLIQNSQNRDTRALQVKLDELIRATEGAQNVLLNLEEVDEELLGRIKTNYQKLAEQAREQHRRGETSTDVPDVDPMQTT